jgi:2'-5' RNA ligase
MLFSVECYFDPVAEGAVRGLWAALAAAQINSRMIEVDARPHISLTAAEGEPTLPVVRRLQEFVSARTWFQIQFGSIGVFPNDLGVLFLAPQASSELARLHLDWCAAVSALEIPVWEHYTPGNWTPHCTLAIGLLPGLHKGSCDKTQ